MSVFKRMWKASGILPRVMRVRAGVLLGLGLLIALGWAQATLPKDLQQRFERATRLAAQGKLREAEPLFRDIVQKQPNFAPAHLSLGLVYRLLNQNDKALTHLRRAATQVQIGRAHV